jgi:DNA-binding response OmpR family regulator
MPSRKEAVLVVDDDARMLRMMQMILETEGYQVVLANNGEDALNTLIKGNIDLILLDIMMPGMDGYTTCSRIREFSQLPIIMVTAKGNVDEVAKGLNCGADDYVTKPFSSKVLLARVRAVLRRIKLPEKTPEPIFKSGDLVVDFTQRKITKAGEAIELTATEYKLLSYLIQNAGRLSTSDQILEAVWGDEYIGEHLILRVNIARLRNKLGDDAKEPKFIASRVGIGYMFLKSHFPPAELENKDPLI